MRRGPPRSNVSAKEGGPRLPAAYQLQASRPPRSGGWLSAAVHFCADHFFRVGRRPTADESWRRAMLCHTGAGTPSLHGIRSRRLCVTPGKLS